MDSINKRTDLSGEWICKLDNADVGIMQKWYLKLLDGQRIKLPGTLAENGIGNRYEREEGLTKENVRCLRSKFQYIGAAWYQKEIVLEEEVCLSELKLFFERVMFQSMVWINEIYIGRNDSLSAPHIFEPVIEDRKLKKLRITICIDNRDLQKIGNYSSAYTDETQTIWNGIIGSMYLCKKEVFKITKYNISADAENHAGIFDIEISARAELLKYGIIIRKDSRILLRYEGNIEKAKQEYRIKVHVPLNDEIILWNEFHPNCYEIELKLINEDGEVYCDNRKTGFSKINRSGNQIHINGVKSFLRGNIDCCLYPLTGYPPMEKEMWHKVMGKTKEYGFNHIRFHSWCPPDAAFEAADELGIYLQIEGPMWLDNWMDLKVGGAPEQYEYLPDEAERIIRQYSYHSSFCLFSNGNELNGDFKLLEDMIARVKAINPYLLYTLTTNWDRELNKEDDIFISQAADGIGIRGQYFLESMVNTTCLHFNEGVAERTVPVISHEVGQYVVYPDINEIAKYRGNLEPVNLEVIKQDLDKKKLRDYVPDFIYSSGKLAYELYKAEFEAALNTKEMAGVQILSLHDFPGQSTATVGLLDVFFESKGITSDTEFKQFCNARVLLLQLEKKIFLNKEKINAALHIANYMEKEGYEVKVEITVSNHMKILHREEIVIRRLEIGLNQIGTALSDFNITGLSGRQKLKIEAMIAEEDIHNEWYIWVYEDLKEQAEVFDSWNEDIIKKLKAGENVVLTPKPRQIKEIIASKYFPVFWSPVHFRSKDPCGMLLKDNHPFFTKYYKSGRNADYEWKVFLENAYAINLDSLEGFAPMTMLVPNFFNNHKGSGLFELKVGQGNLLVCCYDFDNTPIAPQTAYLKKAIWDYVNSADFKPAYQCELSVLEDLFCAETEAEAKYRDIALSKNASADSEKSNANAARRGNDGNPISCWMAADQKKGHYWQVDLERVYHICGTKVEFNEKGRYRYVIQISADGVNWDDTVNRTVAEAEYSADMFDAEARYVRIVYHDMSGGIMAGHKAFLVYEKSNFSKSLSKIKE